MSVYFRFVRSAVHIVGVVIVVDEKHRNQTELQTTKSVRETEAIDEIAQ